MNKTHTHIYIYIYVYKHVHNISAHVDTLKVYRYLYLYIYNKLCKNNNQYIYIYVYILLLLSCTQYICTFRPKLNVYNVSSIFTWESWESVPPPPLHSTDKLPSWPGAASADKNLTGLQSITVVDPLVSLSQWTLKKKVWTLFSLLNM